MAVSIKWFPRSWLQVTTENEVVYVDPAYLSTLFRGYPKRIQFSKWPDPIDGLPEEMEKAHLILVTHHHKDHCKLVTVNRLRHPGTLLVASRACVRELGKEIRVVQPGDSFTFHDVTIRAVAAYNTEEGSSTRKLHQKGRDLGYVITMKGRTIYHAGDTDFVPEMRELGDVDVALLPIGGRFTMDVREAVEAARAIEPKIVIPVHRLAADPQEFARQVEERSNIKAVPLGIGDTCLLEDQSARPTMGILPG